MRKSFSVSIAMLASLAGCGGAFRNGPEFDTNVLMPVYGTSTNTPYNAVTTDGSMIVDVINPKACQDVESLPATDATFKSLRNDCMWSLIRIIDDKYAKYSAGLRALTVNTSAVVDVVGLGLSTAATAIGAAAAKTVLSAINTGLTGAKGALDTDYLYNKSIDIVLNEMDADRSGQLAQMVTRMQATPDLYGMSQAKDDLLKYYWSGTFAQALKSLETKTAANAAACQVVANDAKANATNTASTPVGATPQAPAASADQGSGATTTTTTTTSGSQNCDSTSSSGVRPAMTSTHTTSTASDQ